MKLGQSNTISQYQLILYLLHHTVIFKNRQQPFFDSLPNIRFVFESLWTDIVLTVYIDRTLNCFNFERTSLIVKKQSVEQNRMVVLIDFALELETLGSGLLNNTVS